MSKLQNKRFLFLLSGTDPSSFVRALVYQDEFKKENHVEYFRLNSKILSPFEKSSKSFYPAHLVYRILNKLYYLNRIQTLLKRINKYDVIIAVKNTDSKLMAQIKFKSKALLIYDFDDAVWLDLFHGEVEFSKKISTADCITSDNIYLANRASNYNKNSFVVHGPCQIEKFIAHKKINIKASDQNKTIVLGWIGSPYTLFYLYKIYDALELIGEKYPHVILKLVGTGNERLLLPPFEKIKLVTVPAYNQEEMIQHVYSFDIGLYPLFANELSLGRGSLKATIYMSGRIPLICSAIGENTAIIEDGINGFIAGQTEEWVEKLSLLIENPSLRKELGENGFRFAEKNYTISNCLSQLLDVVSKFPNE